MSWLSSFLRHVFTFRHHPPAPVPTVPPIAPIDPPALPVPAPAANLPAQRLVKVAWGPFAPRFYPYWSNVWVDDEHHCAYVFAGSTTTGAAQFFRVSFGVTGEPAVEPMGNLLPMYPGTTEGWSWDSVGWIYLCDRTEIRRINPFTGEDQVVLSRVVPDTRLWQSHSTDDGRTHCATVQRTKSDGPYENLGTVWVRDGRAGFVPATGALDESQVTDQFLIIKEIRQRDGGARLDNRVIDLDTGEDEWWLDEGGAVGHSDCEGGVLVGEDDYIGACVRRDLRTRERTILFSTWNMGHVALRRGVCLQSDHAEGALFRVLLDGTGRQVVYRHGVVTGDYDRQVRACLDPTGRVAAFLQEGELYLYVL